MAATASVSSPWIPEDDLLLKNSIEGGASLEALAKGAVKFSRRFTYRELRDRWYSLLYDPDVSAQASARMAELEQSGSNPLSKFKLDNSKVLEKLPEKRKTTSIRRQYYAMQKRLKNEFFSSPNLGFFEERKFQNHVTTNHEAPGGNDMLDDCLANNLGFEEKDFEILRQAFPESLGDIATTNTIVVENNFINGDIVSPSRSKLIGSCTPKGNEVSDPSETPNEKLFKTDKPVNENDNNNNNNSNINNNQIINSGFGKHHFNSPISDGSASFHTMGFSSPSARLPLWKTLEDISAPDMPIDENNNNNAESQQTIEETLTLPEDHDHRNENKTEGCRPNGFINPSGVHEGEFTDLPDSLLNFSNEDDILFMDVDVKDTNHTIHDHDHDHDIIMDQCVEESKDLSFNNEQHDVASTSDSQLTEGKIICVLNTEDPEIPCNDDIFLLIHPSTTFTPSVGLQIATDSLGPLSSSSHEKDGELGLTTVRNKGKESGPCFNRSNTGGQSSLPEFVSGHSLVGCAFKRELSDGEYMVPVTGKINNVGISNQSRSMHAALEINGSGMVDEDANKVELRGLDSPLRYNEMPLPLEVGAMKMTGPESMDDSYVSDQNNSDSDDDIPYFSDVEAMILEMDLAHSQESCMTSEVARYQYEGNKRMIIRLEQAARSSFQRAMSSQGALGIFYGRRLKYFIKKSEVTIGRSTDDTEVDIDLRKEGRANKISRRQAIIKMETDGSFNLKNLGSSSISLNGKEVAHGQVATLGSSCLIEIRGMSFVFEINDKYVRRYLANQ